MVSLLIFQGQIIKLKNMNVQEVCLPIFFFAVKGNVQEKIAFVKETAFGVLFHFIMLRIKFFLLTIRRFIRKVLFKKSSKKSSLLRKF